MSRLSRFDSVVRVLTFPVAALLVAFTACTARQATPFSNESEAGSSRRVPMDQTLSALNRQPGAPAFTETHQSTSSVVRKGTEVLRVLARDPQGGPLKFSWGASAGTLSGTSDTASSSQVLWETPPCVEAGAPPPTVTAAVANGLGLSDSFTFSTVASKRCESSVGSVAAGNSHTLALDKDGTLWVWGSNYWGQVGNGTTTQRAPRVQHVLTGVSAIAAGYSHSVALKHDGTVWTWGANSQGQVGDGHTANRTTPVQVLTGVSSIAARDNRTLALERDGTLWVWGNDRSKIRAGVVVNQAVPERILTEVSAMAVGGYHALALKKNGTVWAWGDNRSGQLGDGRNYLQTATPVQVQGLSRVIAIDAGDYHSVALEADGTLWAWGHNSFGEVGDGTTTHRSTPVRVLSGVSSMAAGSMHTLARKKDGTVWAWGHNDYGQVGNDTTTDRYTPVQLAGISDVVAITASGGNSMAIDRYGALWAWGDNSSHQVGDGGKDHRTTPVQVLAGVSAVAIGEKHTVALKRDGTFWVWGNNYHGQLGTDPVAPSAIPSRVSVDEL